MSNNSIDSQEQHAEKQDILVKCKGQILFEDFEHKLQWLLLLEIFFVEMYDAINDFEKPEHRITLKEAIEDDQYTKSASNVLVQIGFTLYIPENFVEHLLYNLNGCVQSAISGSITVNTLSNRFCFEKEKADIHNEVQCNGKLIFASAQECLVHYETLAFKLENSFFKYPNTGSPDIYISNQKELRLRSHAFFSENVIDKNMTVIENCFNESLSGRIVVIIDGKEKLLEKEIGFLKNKTNQSNHTLE